MKKITILGYSYTVDKSNTLDDMAGNIGLCDLDKKILSVAKEVDDDYTDSVILHEILEAINYHLDINLSESQIKQLEVGLHQTLNENGVSVSPLHMEE